MDLTTQELIAKNLYERFAITIDLGQSQILAKNIFISPTKNETPWEDCLDKEPWLSYAQKVFEGDDSIWLRHLMIRGGIFTVEHVAAGFTFTNDGITIIGMEA